GDGVSTPFRLGDISIAGCSDIPSKDLVSDGTLLFGLYGSLIANSGELLQELAQTEVRRHLSPTIQAPSYHLAFTEAFRAYCRSKQGSEETLKVAVQEAKCQESGAPIDKCLLVPQVGVLEAMCLYPALFESRLTEALKQHKQFCTNE